MPKPAETIVAIPQTTTPGRTLGLVLKSAQEGIKAVFDLGDDISDENRKTFVKHVSNITRESGNQFPIKEDSTFSFLRDGNGNQLPPSPDNVNGQKSYLQTFRDAGDTQAIESFAKTSNGGMLNTDTPFALRTRGRDDAPFSIDELYRDVDNNLDESHFAKRVRKVLGDNATHGPNAPFLAQNLSTDNDIKIASIKSDTFGEYGPKKFPKNSQVTEKEMLTIRELKKVGMTTMLLATGEIITPSMLDQPVDIVGRLSSATPGLARSGLKIPVSRFTANSSLKEIKPGYARTSDLNIFDDKELHSYGSYNSAFVPFAALAGAPSILNATILVATVGSLLKAFKLFELVGKAVPNNAQLPFVPNAEKRNRKDFIGSYHGKKKTFKVIDIVDTDHDFYKCLDKGMAVFFDTGASGTLRALSDGITRVAKIHGYYNVILRNVVRSLYDLVNPSNIINDATGGGNVDPSSVITAADPRAVIEKFNNSIALKFVNMLLTIGDKTLNILDQQPNDSLDDFLGNLNSADFLSDIDSIPDTIRVKYGQDNVEVLNPAILQAKGRLSNGQTAIGNSSVRSLLMVPGSILGTGRAMDRENQMLQSVAELKKNNFVVTEDSKLEQSKKRIKSEIVEQVENYLEADYAPFYFHDIRTNEILSFHAFLYNVQEALDVEYSDTGGYGRVGEVGVYKNTKRTLSLQFGVLASSDEDFDEMWYKINKLGTMCYPQWTEGRVVSYGANKFIQPFSQLPGASPIIRLRVGDLVKGNYSKLNAARLFGLSGDIGPGQNSTFNISSLPQTPQDSTAAIANSQRIIDSINRILERQRNRVYEAGDIVRIRGNVGNTTYPKVIESTSTAANTVGGAIGQSSNNVHLDMGSGLQSVTDVKGRIVRVDSDGSIIVSSITMMNDQPVAVRRTGSNATTVSTNDQFLIPVGSLIPNAEFAQRQVGTTANAASVVGVTQEQQADTNITNSQIIQTFFDDSSNSSNPIMRAFASTKGRGLAGTIRNMSMDYENATWVTHRQNSRAPMLVKISITFAPIHDIQPGLDSNGFMTAPIWNVGDHVKSFTNNKDELAKQLSSIQNAAASMRIPSQR